jgi:hypothetical protein
MLSKNIIGIDFGASFTKIAYREGFTRGRVQKFEERETRRVFIDGDDLIPTMAIETGRERRPWVLGKQAAGIKPGPGMKVHRNWKARLLKSDGDPPDPESLGVAHAFFEWLLGKLSEDFTLPFEIQDAIVMLCVPAFKGSGVTLKRLAAVMEEAGWSNEFILRTSEPKANTLGFCTGGKNIRTTYDTPNWGDMFDMTHPFISYTRNPASKESATLAVLDIGSFTCDLALIDWHPGTHDDYLDDGSQTSFRHGIVEQLDAVCLPPILEAVGESIEELGFGELESLKERLYRGSTYDLGGFEIGDKNDQLLIKRSIAGFCKELWGHIKPMIQRKPVRWFILTGGGANIPGIYDDLSGRFQKIRCGEQTPRPLGQEQASRGDTSVGATSLILVAPKGAQSAARNQKPSSIQPLPPLRNCPCGGANKNCMRCGGTGTLGDELLPAKFRRPATKKPATSRRTTEEVEVEIDDLEPEEVISPDDTEGYTDELPESLLTNDRGSKREHTLEGWMGTLVFETQPGENGHSYKNFAKLLTSGDTEIRNRAWFRLLCLACALGARVPRSTIRNFWQTPLQQTGFWKITTGGTREESKLDEFFEQLIHREFRSVYAAGEQAELLRRVFYDFRKLHFLTYQNDFPEVILEILNGIDDGMNPVLFLRSGALPDGSIWRGVLGQSMTSPLLFLMREWRRMGLITSDRVDDQCYYMNASARRGAFRKGWLSKDDLYAYSLQDILEASRKTHEKLLETQAWDPMLFDVPLQIAGSRRRKRKS